MGDPGLGPLADHGGPTATHALLGRSLASMPGRISGRKYWGCHSIRAGEPRVQDGWSGMPQVDIGAYEATPAPHTYVVTTALDEDNGTLGAGQGDSLREVLEAANDNVGADRIEFDLPPNALITLAAGQLPAIVDNLTIVGPGAKQLAIGNDPDATVLVIGTPARAPDVEVSGVTLRGGRRGIENFGSLTVRETVVADNLRGGGIRNEGVLWIEGSTVNGNNSNSSGGGIYNAGEFTILNTTVSGNLTRDDGGGIYDVSNAPVLLVHATITENWAAQSSFGGGRGGGIFTDGGSLTLHNSIVANNHVTFFGSSSNIRGEVNPISSFNLIGSNGRGGLANTQGNQIVITPNLGPLADNGGPTPTHALLGDSPARRRRQQPLVPDLGTRIRSAWQRIPAGLFDGSVHVGAFESGRWRQRWRGRHGRRWRAAQRRW